MANTKWVLDPIHSDVIFKIKHLMISTVTGHFKKFDLVAETETGDFSSVKKLEFTADVDSITTHNDQRDGHLKSTDFFNVEQFPKLRFVGKSYDVKGDDGTITGELTIAWCNKAYDIKSRIGRYCARSLWTNKSRFYRYGKTEQERFRIKLGYVTETGSVVLSDEVKINAEIQLVKQVEKLAKEEQLA